MRSVRLSRRNFVKGAALTVVTTANVSSLCNFTTQEPQKTVKGKQKPTIYTPEKISNARENIARYDWAKSEKDRVVAEADHYLTRGLHYWWGLITPQSLPRSYAVNEVGGSPTTGLKINEFGTYPYTYNAFAHPWKITDPSTGLQYPSNDFAGYYTSGLDVNGIFTPALADRSLLKNTLYPDKPVNWGVDDGFGWVDENGNRFTFVAYYVHWALWDHKGLISRALSAFRQAFVFTGNPVYAQAGIVMLVRIADVYPDMDSLCYKWEDGFRNSHGGTGQGKVLGCIWETEYLPDMIRAYDAFFLSFKDEAVLTFLRSQSFTANRKIPLDSAAAIQLHIEEGFIKQIFPAIKKAQIHGNTGMHQMVLALAAVAYDTFPDTKEWLNFNFQAGERLSSPNWHVTGGNLLAVLVNDLDRDGFGYEASPDYNNLWFVHLKLVADILLDYKGYTGADLYKNPKFRKMFYSFFNLILSDHFTAQIGDSGATGNRGIIVDPKDFACGYQVYKDPLLARLAYYFNGNTSQGMRGDIFSRNPLEISAEIDRVILKEGAFSYESVNLSGYGFAALRKTFPESEVRGGIQKEQHDLWLYFGRSGGHGHSDKLNIGLHAFGLDLAPDLGYPERTGEWPSRLEWTRNTISHNTVVVDECMQTDSWEGTPLHFENHDFIRLIDVDASKAYPQTSEYRRTVAMVSVDDEQVYYLDLFRISGGNHHHFSFHGGESLSVSTSGIRLTPQSGGTYAGADVSYATRKDSKGGWDYKGSGFHYLKNAERDTDPACPFSVDWLLVGNRESVQQQEPHLKLTMLNCVDDVALADGIPPVNGRNPASLRYMVAHRKGVDLQSVFISVLEPYLNHSQINSCEKVSVRCNNLPVADTIAVAVKVCLKNGRTDYLVQSTNPAMRLWVDGKYVFQGFFGALAERNGKIVKGFISDGGFIGKPAGVFVKNAVPAVTGTVTGFTKELRGDNCLIVSLDRKILLPESLKGRTIYINNEGKRNATYRIEAVSKTGSRKLELALGNVTLIQRFADDHQTSSWYIYDIAEGDKFRIPMSSSKLIHRF
ncbi:heparinase II/III domain-containing protein [Dyadobacter frigoris]|uniref:Heparinase II/III-like C-terminal domain-containing protein n=1 Tax=Dyadobacter frigoris TaxID=2576211 RepID=A0A4U6D7V8_9BACT|nr:heparinase II/III family protein [Dyadobacter frigoris]TKT92218.1 hypothetical protein FDK13_09525 [Dyadobacter frigoris]GLU53392.1 hypothetical protein Dfri01_28530 [Dyadobacter frigoris]